MEGFEGHFQYIDIPKNMNIEVFRCLVKSIRPLLCPNRSVYYLGPEPVKLLKTIKNDPKT